MKKPLLTLISLLLMNHTIVNAQTETPKILPPSTTNKVSAVESIEQKIQMNAGIIHECAIEKPIEDWTNLSISLDKVNNKLELFSVAVLRNKQIQPIEVCDKKYVTQAMLELFKLTTQGKTVDWQSLSFRSRVDRKFSFHALTAKDIAKLTSSTKKP